jgi:hypothetical protein
MVGITKENMMSRKFLTLIAFLVLLTGVVAFTRSRLHRAQRHEDMRTGFTLQSVLSENGNVYATSVRYVKADGQFFVDTTYLNADGSPGRHAKLFGTADRGALVLDNSNKKLDRAGRAVMLHNTSEAELKALGFDREAMFLGYRVIVQRQCVDQNQHCAEYWLAPALGGAPLKFDLTDPDGTRRVEEVTRVIIGEPSFAVPDYPVDNSIQDRIQQMRGTSPSQKKSQ